MIKLGVPKAATLILKVTRTSEYLRADSEKKRFIQSRIGGYITALPTKQLIHKTLDERHIELSRRYWERTESSQQTIEWTL
ncbi:hypothetical protein J6590_085408, partial [Homalodisca vitripennis]